MKTAICLDCRYLGFNLELEKWECTRPGWRQYIKNPGIPIKCPFFVRRKDDEKIRIAPTLR